jgi:hypothetical protein
MATKSVLKSSVAASLVAALGMSLMLPAAAQAQERPDRGERGAGRAEHAVPAPMRAAPAPNMPRPVERTAPSSVQAPSWQGRSPAANAQPSWGGRPASFPGQVPAWQSRGPAANPQPSWNGRPATVMQSGQPDRGRPSWQQGDRSPNGAPTNPRPSWQQGTQSGNQGTGSMPSWGGRNPTYADPARNPDTRPQPGRNDRPDNRNVDHTDDHSASWSKDRYGKWYRDTGWQWRQDRAGQWYRDHDANWGRNSNGQWYRNGWGANTSRDWSRGRGGWNGNNGWGYNTGYNSGYSNGYSNGWRAWDRDEWRHDNRYNWYGWRSNHRDVFRGGYYTAPYSGYSYSRLSIGIFLGNAFFDQRYWITDPYAYRLPAAYAPYQWVRYYGDVLLIDTYSGEVVDVIYDFFD